MQLELPETDQPSQVQYWTSLKDLDELVIVKGVPALVILASVVECVV